MLAAQFQSGLPGDEHWADSSKVAYQEMNTGWTVPGELPGAPGR